MKFIPKTDVMSCKGLLKFEFFCEMSDVLVSVVALERSCTVGSAMETPWFN